MATIKVYLNLSLNGKVLEQKVVFIEPKIDPPERLALFTSGADLVYFNEAYYRKVEDIAYIAAGGIQRRTLVYELDQKRLKDKK